MNPEEGELRPQLLDRFGLCVDVKTEQLREHRKEIARRALSFQRDPEGFKTERQASQETLRAEIARARERLPTLTPSETLIDFRATASRSKAPRIWKRRIRFQGGTGGLGSAGRMYTCDLDECPHRLDMTAGRRIDRNAALLRGMMEGFDPRFVTPQHERRRRDVPGKRSTARTEQSRGRYIGAQHSGSLSPDIAFERPSGPPPSPNRTAFGRARASRSRPRTFTPRFESGRWGTCFSSWWTAAPA